MECHDTDVKKGGLDLTTLSLKGSDAAAHKQWVRVFDRVTAGEMPPAKRDRPASPEQKAFLSALGESLTASHQTRKSTVLRRLNRQEYQNTLHQLLGVSVSVMSLLPEDGRAEGFDNVGEALSISGIQMQRYMEAAGLALDAALLCGDRPASKVETFTLNSERNDKQNRGKQWLWLPDGAIVVFNNGGFPSTEIPNLKAHIDGTYRLKVSGYGYQIQEPVVFAVMVGNFNRGGDVVIDSFHELPADKLGTAELTLHLRQGDGIKISPQGLNGPDGHSPTKDGPDKYPGEGLALKEVVMEGPLVKEWPPRGQPLLLGEAKVSEVPPKAAWMRAKRGYQPVFKAEIANPSAEAAKLLPRFLTAAFRRPITADEAQPYVKLAESELADGRDFLNAMRTAAVAALFGAACAWLAARARG
jgi:hypothetical protein